MSISFEVIALVALFVLPVIFVLQTMASNSRSAAWAAPAAARTAPVRTALAGTVVEMFPAANTGRTAAAA